MYGYTFHPNVEWCIAFGAGLVAWWFDGVVPDAIVRATSALRLCRFLPSLVGDIFSVRRCKFAFSLAKGSSYWGLWLSPKITLAALLELSLLYCTIGVLGFLLEKRVGQISPGLGGLRCHSHVVCDFCFSGFCLPCTSCVTSCVREAFIKVRCVV